MRHIPACPTSHGHASPSLQAAGIYANRTNEVKMTSTLNCAVAAACIWLADKSDMNFYILSPIVLAAGIVFGYNLISGLKKHV